MRTPVVAARARVLIPVASLLLTLSRLANATPTLPTQSQPAAPASPVARPTAATSRVTAPTTVQPGDGQWTELDPLQVAGSLGVYDAVNDRLLSLGGTRESGWALPLTGAPQWQALPAVQPELTLNSQSAWDPEVRLAYAIGASSSGLGVWSYDPATGATAPVVASGHGPEIGYPTLVSDPARHRILLLQPVDGSYAPNDTVWVLDLLPTPAWSARVVHAPPSMQTFSPNCVVDETRDRLLVVGPSGFGGIFALPLDVPGDWSVLPGSDVGFAPCPNPFVFDVAGDRILTLDAAGTLRSFDLAAESWSAVVPAGPPALQLQAAIVALDTQRHRLLVSGGAAPGFTDVHNGTWALPLDGPLAWTAIVPEAVRPTVRGAATDGYDAARNRLVVFSGSDELGGVRNDTWSLDLNSAPMWSPVATTGTPPPPRYWAASAWDPHRDQLVVFGGYGGDWQHSLGDLWTLSFAGGTPTWSPVTPAGAAPPGREMSSLVYDDARDRFLLLFGESNNALLDDVWELKLGAMPAWRKLAPTGPAPVARGGAMAAYDPFHDVVLAFGGGNTDGIRDDLWRLDFHAGDGVWTPVTAPGGPSARNDGVLCLDPLRRRLVLFGGYGIESQQPGYVQINYLADTWALSLDALSWTALAPAGGPPARRDRADGAFDPAGDRFVVTCGGISGSNDTWTLDFGGLPTPALLALESQDVTPECATLVWAGATPGEATTAYRRAPAGAWTAIASLAADGEGRVRLEDRGVTPGATLEYRLGVATVSGETYFGAVTVHVPAAALSLAAAPATRGLAFAIRLPDASPAELSLFDVTGRRVWRRDVGALGAGAHVVSDAGARLPSALYFARLTQGAARTTARIVLAR